MKGAGNSGGNGKPLRLISRAIMFIREPWNERNNELRQGDIGSKVIRQ